MCVFVCVILSHPHGAVGLSSFNVIVAFLGHFFMLLIFREMYFKITEFLDLLVYNFIMSMFIYLS